MSYIHWCKDDTTLKLDILLTTVSNKYVYLSCFQSKMHPYLFIPYNVYIYGVLLCVKSRRWLNHVYVDMYIELN